LVSQGDNALLKSCTHFLLSLPQYIHRLQVEPVLGSRPHPVGEAKRGGCSDPSLALDDLRDAILRHLEHPSQLSLRHSTFREIDAEMHSWVNGWAAWGLLLPAVE
jgi:hypothetical protein